MSPRDSLLPSLGEPRGVWPRKKLMLAAVGLLLMGLGWALLHLSVLYKVIDPPDFAQPPFVAGVFVVAALLALRVGIALGVRHTLTLYDFGRDLTWDGLAFAAALFGAYLASSIDLHLVPGAPEFRGLVLAITGLTFLLLVILCEGAVEAITARHSAAARTIPCTLGVFSYLMALLLTLSHIPIRH